MKKLADERIKHVGLHPLILPSSNPPILPSSHPQILFMKSLSATDIQKLASQFKLMEAKDLQKLGMQFLKKQPLAYEYVLAKSETTPFNQDEKELLLYLSIMCHSMVTHAIPPVPKPKKVPLANFEESEILNLMLFTGLEDAPNDKLYAKYDELGKEHVQPEIAKFLLEAIWHDESGAKIQEPNRHYLMRILLSLLDGLVEM